MGISRAHGVSTQVGVILVGAVS